jgi:hypothetical protein
MGAVKKSTSVQVIATVVPSSPILVTLMLKAIRSSETSVLTRTTRSHIPEDGILHSYCRGNLKSYVAHLFTATNKYTILIR